MGNITVFSGQTVPFLALWDDVIEGSPRPKLNGYQRPIPGGACGAKGLGGFRQTPASKAFWNGNLHGTYTRSQRVNSQRWTGMTQLGLRSPKDPQDPRREPGSPPPLSLLASPQKTFRSNSQKERSFDNQNDLPRGASFPN